MTDKEESSNLDNPEEKPQNKEDEELSALLDSALEDFNKTEKSDPKESSQVTKPQNKRPDPPANLWNEEFLQQTTARFEQNIQALFSPGSDGSFSIEQLGENIQRLAEAATQTAGFEASPDTEFSSIIAQTLKNLSENAENLQNQMSDEDLMNLLGTFSNITDSSAGDGNGLLPIMQQMMQNLLSKEILYPALSGIVEKYPEWLENNKSKLSSEEFEKYTEQFNLMKKVCEELDKEKPDDSQESKSVRFDVILGLMQKIQDCGQPPADLAGDLGPLLNLDENGYPQFPPNFSPNQCNLM